MRIIFGSNTLVILLLFFSIRTTAQVTEDIPAVPVKADSINKTDSLWKAVHHNIDTAFIPGDNRIFIGYGFIPIDGDVIKWIYNTPSQIFGPIYLKIEHAIDYHWTLGINLAYGHYHITSPTYYFGSVLEYRTDNTFSIIARTNYHPGMFKNFDPYVGFGLGYRISSSDYTTLPPETPPEISWDNKFPVGFETTAGIHYIMSKRTSLYAECGIAKSALQLGLVFKL